MGYAINRFSRYIIMQWTGQQGGQEGQRTMKRSSVCGVAIMVGIVPALLAQSGTRYSQEEAERRLARVQEIAAASNGRIEITVIRVPAESGARAHGPLAEPLPAEAESALQLPAATAAPADPFSPLPAAKNNLSAPEASGVAWGGEFTPRQDPNLLWLNRFDRALALHQKGSSRAALKILLRLTYTHPDHPRCGECYYQMGESLTALGEHALAERAFRQVLRYPECARFSDALRRVE